MTPDHPRALRLRRPLPVLAFALLLAGCTAAPPATDPADPSDPAAATSVLPWGLTRCRYVVGFTPVEEAALAPHLPEGFAATPDGPFAGTPLARVMLGVEAFACESGLGLEGEVAPMAYGSIFVTVEPPPELVDDDSAFHMLKWDILVPDAPRRERLAVAGLPVHDGSARVEDLPGGGRRGVLELDGVGTFLLEMVPTQQAAAPQDPLRFTELTPSAQGGFARWRTDFAWDSETLSQGRGVVSWPEGSWASEVVGTNGASSTFHSGTWTFSNGTITLPS